MRSLLAVPLLVLAPAAAAQHAGEGFEVKSYAVVLRPDLATRAMSGRETIVLRSTTDGTRSAVFSGNALTIDMATVDGAPASVAKGRDTIGFALPRPLRKGEAATLRFAFSGTPARGVEAVPSGLYTSYFACDWMVCLQDAPGDKAAFRIDLDLPRGWQSLGVGRRISLRSIGGGMERHSWRSTAPFSAYLFGFAAGHFAQASLRLREGELTYFDGTDGQANLPALFARTASAVSFFTEKAGVGLADRRYAQLLVPGDEAQESVSFSLIGKSNLDGERDDPNSSWVIAHELAHQWWGNRVTCASWRDFWLNEGVTTFMVAAWKQKEFGEAAYRAELDNARNRRDRAREAGFDKPLAWGGKYPTLGTRRAVQYFKGALFLAHLRETLGDAPFWAGLRLYTRRHAGGTVTSRDFQRAMEEASARDLGPLFRQWVYGED